MSESELHVVLVEPEIPQNTGNIARTCAAVGASLHLVEPLGFSISDRYLKRAGLDYWHLLEVNTYDGLDEYFARNGRERCFFLSTRGESSYTTVEYPMKCSIVFGKETAGLPEELLTTNRERSVRIPIRPEARALNLSNAVAVVAYEILRQHGFPNLF